MLVKEVEVEVYTRKVFKTGGSLGIYLPTRVGEYYLNRNIRTLYAYLDNDSKSIIYTPKVLLLDRVQRVRIQVQSVNLYSKKSKAYYRISIPKDFCIELDLHSGDLVQLKFYPEYGIIKIRKIE